MSERVVCFDTSILVKFLTPDEQEDAVTRLVDRALQEGARLVAPAWAWAELGSVLLKKVRMGLLEITEATQLWTACQDLPIEYVESPSLRRRAWEIARRLDLPTLYDAGFFACTELAAAGTGTPAEFWTADTALLRQLGNRKPAYVRSLRDDLPAPRS
ncbi:PilT domain-containing protein [Thermaerobacter marianensis DSM 12885]|uniref:PilT domain-containing protein n=1 Tax=Thermaerobacter marianensis (strain ATCC 700841 / DSM 12885 / JCM 10246 / 7p75a) TaxID=644966 RepID=E6SME5_THEM7|nr:type II toxin-antitoxin system VapC family toxin [Thermaerobacter marianensis]ADU50405.1 PilT domain-containing protein [Thermaerobacter marianensis DSM 12885]